MGSLGGWEIFWIVLVILILFGAKRIPEMMKGLGQGVKEFKKAVRDVQTELEAEPPAKPAAPAKKNEAEKTA